MYIKEVDLDDGSSWRAGFNMIPGDLEKKMAVLSNFEFTNMDLYLSQAQDDKQDFSLFSRSVFVLVRVCMCVCSCRTVCVCVRLCV